MSSLGRRRTQTSGRSGLPKRAQRWSAVSWTQRTPAGFPRGIPGMGEEMEGAMQQAPQPLRQVDGGGMAGPSIAGTGPRREESPHPGRYASGLEPGLDLGPDSFI
jgi:hypothetical protein